MDDQRFRHSDLEVMDAPQVIDILAVLRRRKLLILVVFLLVAGGVAVTSLLLPNQYESRMKVLVKNERAGVVVTPERTSGYSNPAEVSEAKINTEIELLNSNDLLSAVVRKCNLDRAERGATVSSPLAIEKAVRRLTRDLKIAPVRKADIIQVAYKSRDPRQAAAVLRQLADTYLENHLKVHASPGSYEFFKAQAARYHEELQQANARLAEFRQLKDIVMLSQQKDSLLSRTSDSEAALMQVDAAIREYTSKVAETNQHLGATPSRIATLSRTIPNQYSVERLNTMLAELQNRRIQLLTTFQPEDRLVKDVEQQIANTQKYLERSSSITAVESSTDSNPLRQSLELDLSKAERELDGLKARRSVLAGQVAAQRKRLMNLANATEEQDALLRAQKNAEENYVLYNKKEEEARIAESLDQQKIANVAIAEAPTEPQLPSGPSKALMMGLGCLLGFFVSLGSAFAAEYFSSGPLNSVEDLKSVPDLAVLAATNYR